MPPRDDFKPQWGPGKPHPDFGKDPNIINEWGHTEFPKFIDVDGKRIIVKDKEEEMQAFKTEKHQHQVGWKK